MDAEEGHQEQHHVVADHRAAGHLPVFPQLEYHPAPAAARLVRHGVRPGDDVLHQGSVLAACLGHRRHRAGRGLELRAARHHPLQVRGRPGTGAQGPGEARPDGLHHHHRFVPGSDLHPDGPPAGLRPVCHLRHCGYYGVLAGVPAAVLQRKEEQAEPPCVQGD